MGESDETSISFLLSWFYESWLDFNEIMDINMSFKYSVLMRKSQLTFLL